MHLGLMTPYSHDHQVDIIVTKDMAEDQLPQFRRAGEGEC